MPVGVGGMLREIRQQWQLTLREVEERSLRFAEEKGDQSYKVSASWLVRLERERHELTVNKLIALAGVYGVSAEELLRSIYPGSAEPVLSQPSTPNGTVLLTEGPGEEPAKDLFSDSPAFESDETALLSPGSGLSQAPYRRGIIGKRDRTLEPMIPPGSIVHIDTRNRAIASRKNWKHEFKRPLYFLRIRDGYVCGWCELDKNSEWLTLVPHPLSPASSRRWKYRTEIENLGRVNAVAIRLAE